MRHLPSGQVDDGVDSFVYRASLRQGCLPEADARLRGAPRPIIVSGLRCINLSSLRGLVSEAGLRVRPILENLVAPLKLHSSIVTKRRSKRLRRPNEIKRVSLFVFKKSGTERCH